MPILKLVDYNPPFLGGFRAFTLDTETGINQEIFESTDKERFRKASGWGSRIIEGKTRRQTFAAIYIRDRSVKIGIDHTEFEAGDFSSASVEFVHLLGKRILLKSRKKEVYEFNYIHSPEDEESDLFVQIAMRLDSPRNLKEFAYTWSALEAGMARPIPEYGLDIDKIDDPFDLEKNISSF